MTSFGSFPEEEETLRDLSIELTTHKEWLERITVQGNKPEDWLEFIEHLKSQSVPYGLPWNQYICDSYVRAFKSIPGVLSKNNGSFLKLLIDYSNLKGENNVEDGRKLFSQTRAIFRKFSIAHIAAAEFELQQGNKLKGQKILEKAEIFQAEPSVLVEKAIQNLNAGKSYLLTANEKEEYFQKMLKIEEKPLLTSSLSVPEGNSKNKFLMDLMTSQTPVISCEKKDSNAAAAAPAEKPFQASDPFGSSEKWVSGSLLSEKWGSCGNSFLSSEGRLSSIFSGSDRRLSSLHNVVDRRLSSLHPVTDRRISSIFSNSSHSSSEKGLASSSSLLSHHQTPDNNNLQTNSDSSSSNSTTGRSISKLFNVNHLPGRVKIDPRTQFADDDDEDDDDDDDNNTVHSLKSLKSSRNVGFGFSHKHINSISEESSSSSNNIGGGVKGHESLKFGKVDLKANCKVEVNEMNSNLKAKMASITESKEQKEEDDDFPKLPTPPKLNFLRIKWNETPSHLPSSSSMSTPTLSLSTKYNSADKTKSVSKTINASDQCLFTKTDNAQVSAPVTPHVFIEPKPVPAPLRLVQPKCHPDTPRPGTDAAETDIANKENVVAPPHPSRRCLEASLDGSLKTSSPATCDSSTLSETLKAPTITVRENINDTVLFEKKPVDGFLAPSASPHAQDKPPQGLSSSSLVSKNLFMSDSSQGETEKKPVSSSGSFQLNLSSCDKENQPLSSLTSAQLKTQMKDSAAQPQENILDSIGVTPLPEPDVVKANPLSESLLLFAKEKDGSIHEKMEKLNPFTDYQRVKKAETPKPDLSKKLSESEPAVSSEIKPRIHPEKVPQNNLQSVNDRPHLHSSRSELVSAKLSSMENSNSMESSGLVPKKEIPLPKNNSGSEREFLAPQPLMDKRMPDRLESLSKAPLPVAESSVGKAQLEKENNIEVLQPKPEMPKPIPKEKKREENSVASDQVPIASYTMNLNQPIQGKKPRTLTVNGKVYMILKIVGRGGSSKVYKVLDQSYNTLAVKHIDFEGATESTIQSYMNEVTLLKRLQYSDLVVKLYDFELDHVENCLYLVLECGETDLAAMFKNRTKKEKVPREMVKFYWGEMLRAVQVLHKEGIVHSDLKPANFLIVGGNLKLIDFGIAGVIQSDRTSMTRDSQMGTLNYMSPEMIMEMQSDTGRWLHKFKISVKSDVWSLGCILYSMIYGKTPFQHITNPMLKLQAIINSNHHIEYGDEYDTDLLDTIKKCLCRNPKERLSIDELLQHPYLAEKSKVPLETNQSKDEIPSTGDVDKLMQDVQSIFNKLSDANLASPNTIKTFRQTLLHQLGSKKEISKVLSQLPNSEKSSQMEVNNKTDFVSEKLEGNSLPKCSSSSNGNNVKEVRAPLQCLNLKDLRRGKVASKDS